MNTRESRRIPVPRHHHGDRALQPSRLTETAQCLAAGFTGPGLLWLTAAATGEGRYAEAAQACLGPLRARTAATTIMRGFMFWYGAGLGVRLGLAGEDAADAAVAGGQALAALGEGHLGRHGGLVDGCYNARQGLAPRNELSWGDYFALEAALGLRGTIATATL